MTPKQKYEERRRLRADRLLREEQRLAEMQDKRDREAQRQEDIEQRLIRLSTAFERIADVMELWADMQVEP